MYINGEWIQSQHKFPVFNPATGEQIGQVVDGSRDDARKAISAAKAALPAWSALSAYERSDKLYSAYQLMMKRRPELAQLMTREQGKPLKAAMNEVKYAADFLLWFAEEAKRIYGQTIPSSRSDQRFLVHRQPVGVVAAVTPWNYPVSMLTRKIAPALAAGCTVVLKPAEATPLCAIAVFEILDEAGIPPGAVNLVTAADPAPIGEEFCTNPDVRKLTFTGSTAVGRQLAQA
ncbi:MAG: aldehyde dehydrogenase family protein, partial [Halieaceae bacterium]|nr:aldehyde dehydrogenase family protein [Halieaceae bacterium]